MQVASVSIVYKADRLIGNSVQLDVISSTFIMKFLYIGLSYTCPLILFVAIVVGMVLDQPDRLQTQKTNESTFFTKLFAVMFCITPILLSVLSIVKLFLAYPQVRYMPK
jgi:4-amino-4-deoxy-L-arabinose transferase-like glycosyltransferase